MSIHHETAAMSSHMTRHVLTDDAGGVLLLDFTGKGTLDGMSVCIGEETRLYDADAASRHPLGEPGRYAAFLAGLADHAALSDALAALGCGLPVASPSRIENADASKIRLTRCLYVYADLYAALNILPPAQDQAVSRLSARLAQYPAPACRKGGAPAQGAAARA